MLCSKCAANLPDGSQLCPKCGQPLSSPLRPRTKRRRRFLVFLLVVLFAGVIVWVVASDGPIAQQVQEMAGWEHDKIILDKQFSVGPHTFRYYKFSLPEGSANVAIRGQFSATAENQSLDKEKDNKDDSSIEVFVLTDAAFTVWQNGSAARAVYDSGIVPTGTVQADLPAGAGVYYLVFSNKAAPKTAKSIRAAVLLRHKNWLRRALTRKN